MEVEEASSVVIVPGDVVPPFRTITAVFEVEINVQFVANVSVKVSTTRRSILKIPFTVLRKHWRER